MRSRRLLADNDQASAQASLPSHRTSSNNTALCVYSLRAPPHLPLPKKRLRIPMPLPLHRALPICSALSQMSTHC